MKDLLKPPPKPVVEEKLKPAEVKTAKKPQKPKTENPYSISEEEERELAELMDSD